ncbi:MAG: nicotinate (nicotinamide) nucleotide adenylyltransferase [Planctomycetes bacterium]|nr:nicotinate (nicotinamide) nucleotide adenylyltransferase [Planctomycetota bacterium]
MAKIALLGGAFDPPHNGHLAVARAVRDARQLDRVDLLVSAGSPHRGGKQNAASAADRAAMAALAVENEIGLGVEECELARPGPSFTVDTIRHLHSLRPQNQYSFILGGDMLADLPNWREIGALLDMVEFICVYRPGFGAEVFARLEDSLGRAVVARLRASHVDAPQLGISSTKVRNAVAAGESIAQYVPQAVEQFIYARGLYRPA